MKMAPGEWTKKHERNVAAFIEFAQRRAIKMRCSDLTASKTRLFRSTKLLHVKLDVLCFHYQRSEVRQAIQDHSLVWYHDISGDWVPTAYSWSIKITRIDVRPRDKCELAGMS